MTQTTVSTDFLQTFQIFTNLRVKGVSQDLRVFAGFDVFLSVQEPVGDLVLEGVLDDGDDTFEFFVGEFTSTNKN